jgi:hypothetical protein
MARITRMGRVFQSGWLEIFPYSYFPPRRQLIRAICVIRGSNFGVRV